MSLPRTDWTVEDAHALPDDGCRYEVIDGALYVTPAPSLVHQRAVRELAYLMYPYARALSLDLFCAPIAVTFSRRREVQPDLSVLPRRTDGTRASRFEDVGVLLLAAEVLSPSSVRTDRQVKRPLYQQERVAEYWIVDTATRRFERWTPHAAQPDVCAVSLTWQPLPAHEPLMIDVAQYFARVLDE